MDLFKLIPQLFFDLIARVVPGVVGLVVIAWIAPKWDWASMLEAAAAGQLSEENVFAFAFFVPLGAGFVVGHLLAPLGKLLRICTQRKAVTEPWREYDWLRTYKPDAGALAAKIRAEYSMHFSMAAAFGLGLAGGALLQWLPVQTQRHWSELLLLLVLMALSLYRGHEAVTTFKTSVAHFYSVAQDDVPKAAPVIAAGNPNEMK
jgi:hypothetical protein